MTGIFVKGTRSFNCCVALVCGLSKLASPCQFLPYSNMLCTYFPITINLKAHVLTQLVSLHRTVSSTVAIQVANDFFFLHCGKSYMQQNHMYHNGMSQLSGISGLDCALIYESTLAYFQPLQPVCSGNCIPTTPPGTLTHGAFAHNRALTTLYLFPSAAFLLALLLQTSMKSCRAQF